MVTAVLTLLFFRWENLRKFPKNLRKFPKTSGKSSENSEYGGKLRKCKCIYAAHKQETFSAPWTVWSCGIRLYVRKSTSGVSTVPVLRRPFCLNSNFLGRVWQPSAEYNGVPKGHYYLKSAVTPTRSIRRIVCRGQERIKAEKACLSLSGSVPAIFLLRITTTSNKCEKFK